LIKESSDIDLKQLVQRLHPYLTILLMGFLFFSLPSYGQNEDAKHLIGEADRLAWINNWVKAGPLYEQAERLFSQSEDVKSALYARIGNIQATMQGQSFPDLSRRLAVEMQKLMRGLVREVVNAHARGRGLLPAGVTELPMQARVAVEAVGRMRPDPADQRGGAGEGRKARLAPGGLLRPSTMKDVPQAERCRNLLVVFPFDVRQPEQCALARIQHSDASGRLRRPASGGCSSVNRHPT
jgi:hypothetical protein